MWSGRRLTRKQLTSRQDHLWLELWKSMGKHVKLKEKQKWSEEKLPLENARKLRGIYFIDPEDTEVKETNKDARKKLDTSVAPALPCKIMKNCGSCASNNIRTKLACILEADEYTRMRMGNSIPHHHEDHIAGKGENSLQHYNLVHKFIPMPQAMKILAAKAAMDKEWENRRKFRRGIRRKSEVKKNHYKKKLQSNQSPHTPATLHLTFVDHTSKRISCSSPSIDPTSQVLACVHSVTLSCVSTNTLLLQQCQLCPVRNTSTSSPSCGTKWTLLT